MYPNALGNISNQVFDRAFNRAFNRALNRVFNRVPSKRIRLVENHQSTLLRLLWSFGKFAQNWFPYNRVFGHSDRIRFLGRINCIVRVYTWSSSLTYSLAHERFRNESNWGSRATTICAPRNARSCDITASIHQSANLFISSFRCRVVQQL